MDDSNSKIVVLLATYNGARYLPQQLESLRRQSWIDWQLVARDDGSSDETRQLLQAAAKNDPRILLLDDGGGRLGVLGNFGALMQWAVDNCADYVFFADQDDVWENDKLSLQLAAMHRAEAISTAATPILLHSDMAVVDAELQPIHSSFMAFQGIRHESANPLATLLAQNFVTGCTMLVNRPLLELATPLPATAVVHDWWFALCAAAAGRIEYLPRATVQYRQHAANAVGAKGYRTIAYWRKKLASESLAGFRVAFTRTVEQAAAIGRRLRDRGIEHPSRESIEQYCTLFDGRHHCWQRLQQVRQLGIRRQRLAMHLAYLAGVGMTRRLEAAQMPPRAPAPHGVPRDHSRKFTVPCSPKSS